MSEAPSNPLVQVCPSCAALIDVSDEEVFERIYCPECGTQLRARTQFRNFTLQSELGSGGMGTVYRALDCNLNRVVALKLLRKEFSASASDVGTLEREAKLTASINHPHVVKVFTFGNDHGQFYIAMELVDHGSLDHRMDTQGRIPELEALEIGIQIASGLQAASDRGLIHRDVKPGNILFADAETAKIVDFGLAQLADEGGEADAEIWGTPYYVAPEKLDRRPEDFRSDIYSLGATLFHAIAGRPPFEAQTASLVALKHLKNQPVSLQAFAPDAANETAHVINRMLDKDPDKRFQSYEDLITHLRWARDTLASRGGRDQRAAKRVVVESESTLAWMGWVSLGTLAAVAVGILLFLFRSHSPPDQARPGTPGTVHPAQSVPAGKPDPGADQARLLELQRKGRTLLLRGNADRALELLSEAAEYTKPDPERNWVRMELVLCHLLQGDIDDAKTVLNDVLETPAADGAPAPGTVGAVARETAALGTAAKPTPAAALAKFDASGPGALSLFILGLKDMHEGALDDARKLIEAFLAAQPKPPHDWIASYKPLAAKVRADLATFAALQPRIAREQDWTPELHAEIQRLLEGLIKDGSPALAQRLDEAATRIGQALEEKRKQQLKELAAKEHDILENARVQYATFVLAFQFEEAAKAMQSATLTLPRNIARLESLKRRAAWLSEFKETLVRDIAARPFEGAVQTTRGLTLQGLAGADAANVHASFPYGKAMMPWTDLPASEIARVADHYIKLQTGVEAARRIWGRGVFSFEMGAQEEAKAKLIEASQLDPSRRDGLSDFLPQTPPAP